MKTTETVGVRDPVIARRIHADNMNLAKRLADVKLKPGVGHVKEVVPEPSPKRKQREHKSETMDNVREFRRSEEERIKNANYMIARRLAELKSIDSRSNVLKELDRFNSSREKFKEQNEIKKQKVSKAI